MTIMEALHAIIHPVCTLELSLATPREQGEVRDLVEELGFHVSVAASCIDDAGGVEAEIYAREAYATGEALLAMATRHRHHAAVVAVNRLLVFLAPHVGAEPASRAAN